MDNFTFPKTPISTVAASTGNEITKAYYDHLVGEINRGTILKAVCKRTSVRLGHTSYHLISIG